MILVELDWTEDAEMDDDGDVDFGDVGDTIVEDELFDDVIFVVELWAFWDFSISIDFPSWLVKINAINIFSNVQIF